MLDVILVPIHRAGWPFIAIFAAVSLVLLWVAEPLGLIGVVLTAWCVFFFRDPDRVTPVRDGLIIAPADGVICRIDRAPPPPGLGLGDTPRERVAIFMNVFDVHVNRAPVGGTVTAKDYRPGKFFNASLDKASEENERLGLAIKLADGKEIACVQIAGLVARRILCDVDVGSTLAAGERFGMIRFGSRVDVYLPEGVAPLVCERQRTTSGETVLADAHSSEPRRQGATR